MFPATGSAWEEPLLGLAVYWVVEDYMVSALRVVGVGAGLGVSLADVVEPAALWAAIRAHLGVS